MSVPIPGYRRGAAQLSSTRKRKQHPSFGKELRGLLASPTLAEVAAIAVDEIHHLDQCRQDGRKHPHEDRLNGELGSVGYLRLYKRNHSIRIYFTEIHKTLWMLMLMPSKRRDKLSPGDSTTLRTRLRDVLNEVSKE